MVEIYMLSGRKRAAERRQGAPVLSSVTTRSDPAIPSTDGDESVPAPPECSGDAPHSSTRTEIRNEGAETLRDLRSLWLVPTLLITLIAGGLLTADQNSFLRDHYLRPALWFVVVPSFVVIYVAVNRRSRRLAAILAQHEIAIATSRDRMAALNAIGGAVAAELEIDRVLEAVCSATARALAADTVTVDLTPRYQSSRPGSRGAGAVDERPPLTLWDGSRSVASCGTPISEHEAAARLECGIVSPAGTSLGVIRAARIGRDFDDVERGLLASIAAQVSTAITNAQNYEESRRRASDFRDLVLRGADAIAATDDINRIATLVSRQACKIISCDGAGIFLFGDDRRLLSPVASVLQSGRAVESSRAAGFYTRPIALGEATLLKAVMSSPGPLTIEDVTAYSEGRAWANYAGIGSMIAAPIVGRIHGAQGVLIVHWTDRRTRTDPEQSQLVGALAAFAAVAIDNAKVASNAKSTQRALSQRNEKLLEETQRRRAELQRLVHRVGDALVAGLSCDSVAHLVVDQVRQMIPCNEAIFWVREESDVFHPLTKACEPGRDTASSTWRLTESRFLREVMDHAHPIVVSDVAEDSRLSAAERMRLLRDHVTSVLVAPLRGRGDQVIGLLTLNWTSPRHTPTPEEFDTADVLAAQAAAALENARLHAQLEEAERSLSAQLEQTTAARDFVERILQNVQAAVFVLRAEPDHVILRANALAESMPDPDHQRDGLVGRRFSDVFADIDDVIGAALDKATRSAEPITLTDVEYGGFERGKTYWTFSIAPQRDPSTRLVSQIIVLALDTTDRILLMQEVERNAGRVEALVRISQRLNATLEPEEIYSIVAAGAVDLLAELDEPGASIYIRDTANGSSTSMASAGRISGAVPAGALVRTLYGTLSPMPVADLTAEIAVDTNESADSAAGLERVDRQPNSILVPLASQGVAIGHLVLESATAGGFGDSGLIDVLTNLASLSAAVIRNAQAFAYEQNIAETLQKSFLPSTPAKMPGLAIAERYFPTLRNEAEIGGDYYDLLVLGPGKLGLFIGDISGKGLAAAVHTAMAKYTLRAFIAQDMSPLEVVSRANVAVARWTGHETFSTLFYGVIDVDRGSVTYVNAGHEPPVLVRSEKSGNGGISLMPTGPILGIMKDAEFALGTTEFGPGDVLTLYTDGLSDARDASGLFFGDDGIREHVAAEVNADVDEICDSLHRRATDFSAGHRLRDDVALLVIKMLPAS